jgi:hypothetical protein
MNNIRNKIVIAIILALAILIPVILGINYLNSTREIKINYKNSHGVQVFDAAADQEGKGGSHTPVTTLKKTGETIRLNKEGSYIVSYKGDEEYMSGHQAIDMARKNGVVNINPYYSESKLVTLLKEETDAIYDSLVKKYPRLILYEIQPGKLYHFGQWYGTTLKYVGDDVANSDTLRVVLHKKDKEWRVVTDPPSISLDKFTYSSIPYDVLSDVNVQYTPMLEKFTTPNPSHPGQADAPS